MIETALWAVPEVVSGLVPTAVPTVVPGVLLAVLSVCLWLRPKPVPALADGGWAARPWIGPGLVALSATLVALSSPRLVPLAAIAGGIWVAGERLWRRRADRLAAEKSAAATMEACEQLSAELAAGQPPGTALDRVAEDWPMLDPVAHAFGLGADVPAALRQVAERPGAADLRLLAAGWQVSHRTGAGLAIAVDRIAATLREEAATRRVVASELASARSTAQLVAGLPVLALAMGSGAGGSPWRFLLTTPIGLACLAAGSALAIAGLWWIEALMGDPT